MSLLTKNRWFRRFGFAAIAALGLGAASMPTSPAQASVRFAIGGPGGIFAVFGGHQHHWDHRSHHYGWYR